MPNVWAYTGTGPLWLPVWILELFAEQSVILKLVIYNDVIHKSTYLLT